ncbi:hypothetical protein INR49_005066 [Caranx melampygus]|nr:hypothetical protein INR49_005066 [Caranx melampygus]
MPSSLRRRAGISISHEIRDEASIYGSGIRKPEAVVHFLFSICPLPFLALGPVLFFSLPLLGEGLSLSLSLQAMGLESGEAH